MKEIIVNNRKYKIIKSREGKNFNYCKAIDDADTEVFIKKLKEKDFDLLNQLKSEIQIVNILTSNKIPKIINYSISEFESYIVYEYIYGVSLDKVNLDTKQALEVIIKVIDILSIFHSKSIVHCDIKDTNILINNARDIYLIDFGNCVKEGEIPLFGSIKFASPELLNKKGVTYASDIYSLGVLLYKLLNRNMLFEGLKKEEIKKKQMYEKLPLLKEKILNLPIEIDLVIQKSTEKEIEKRYKNVLEMKEDINNILKKYYL